MPVCLLAYTNAALARQIYVKLDVLKLYTGIPKLVKIGQKYLVLYTKTLVTLCCCRQHQIATKAFYSSEMLSGY